MSLQQQIDQDLKDAMKAKQADKLNVLRMLKSALKNAAIEKGGADATLDDAESTVVIRKQVKQRQDAVEGFEKGASQLNLPSAYRNPYAGYYRQRPKWRSSQKVP